MQKLIYKYILYMNADVEIVVEKLDYNKTNYVSILIILLDFSLISESS